MPEMEEVGSEEKSHVDHCDNFIRAIRYVDKLAAEIGIGHRAALYAHLGNISYWAADRVKYDEKSRRIINSVRADALVTPDYREPWEFPGA